MNLKNLLLSLLIICLWGPVQAEIPEKTISWPPQNTHPIMALKWLGPVTEIVTRAYAKVGYGVSVASYPWKRGELMVRTGKIHGMFPPWYSKLRATYFHYSDPLFPNEIRILLTQGRDHCL